MRKIRIALFLMTIFLCAALLPGCSQKFSAADLSACKTDISGLTVPDAVRIVGLGEACHGTGEYQKLKAQVFEALVAGSDCRTFVIEGDFGGCLKVERYIHGGEGTAKEAVSEIGFAIYRTQEMADLADWMRRYNETAKTGEDLHFYGMDVQRYDNNKEYLFQVLDEGAPALSEQYQKAFSSLTDESRLNLDSASLEQGARDALALMDAMDKQKSQITGKAGEDAFFFARGCAEAIYACSKLGNSGADYNTLRDSFMADKIERFMERAGDGLLFINGHNGHIGKVSPSGYPCLGELLSRKYQEGYFAIGTDALYTRFNSQQDDGSFTVMEVKNKNDLTRLPLALNGQLCYLDLAEAGEDETWREILADSQSMTALNVGIAKWQRMIPAFYTQKIVPVKTYNALILFRQVNPSTLF